MSKMWVGVTTCIVLACALRGGTIATAKNNGISRFPFYSRPDLGGFNGSFGPRAEGACGGGGQFVNVYNNTNKRLSMLLCKETISTSSSGVTYSREFLPITLSPKEVKGLGCNKVGETIYGYQKGWVDISNKGYVPPDLADARYALITVPNGMIINGNQNKSVRLTYTISSGGQQFFETVAPKAVVGIGSGGPIDAQYDNPYPMTGRLDCLNGNDKP